MKTILTSLLFAASLVVAAEPTRDNGLSVHLLPDRVAKISNEHGGFTVTDPATKRGVKTYAQPKELLAYVEHLPATVRENGIWIVTTHPSSYSETEQAKLKQLIALCAERKIPVYTCRGSELPKGWKRVE